MAPPTAAATRNAPDRDATLAAVAAGAGAVAAAAVDARPDAPTPCDGWDALTLVRHLEGIAGAYLLWTGAALGGRVARLRTAAESARHNATILARLPVLGLREHVARFVALADDHVRLAGATWTTPMLQAPDALALTVGQHAAVAAVEWHVHAWDLARSQGRDHVPEPASLAVCASAWTTVLGDVEGTVPEEAEPSWEDLLAATGRTP